jgi:hypothetical protein
LRTGVLANYYVEIPKKLRSGEINKAAKVAREIRLIYPSDEDFKQAFSKKVLKDGRKARYLLSEIERHAGSGTHKINDDPKKVNLEHVLPRNPSNDWQETIDSIGADFLPEFTYRLGNLALVSTTGNRGIGSKSFTKKKEQLYSRESGITFTHSLASYSTWLKEDIEDRQRKLAEVAVKVWKIDPLYEQG